MIVICQKCGTHTKYRLGLTPICFSCICEIERSSTAESIIKKAEVITGVSYEQMRIKTRKREVIQAKHYAMKILYESKVGSLSFIGDLFGNDYSSVIMGIKKINELIETKQVKWTK